MSGSEHELKIAVVVALWVVAIGAAFWCFLKGGRPGGGCGGCSGGGCGSGGGGCGSGNPDEEFRTEVLEIKAAGPGEAGSAPSQLAVGRVWVGDLIHATFRAQWTPGRSAQPAVFDLVLGDHEDGAGPERRIGVSVTYRNEDGQGEFMLIDAADRPFSTSEVMGKALRAKQVAGSPLAREVFDLAGDILRSLPQFAEIETVVKPED
jgi:hypothetical protein